MKKLISMCAGLMIAAASVTSFSAFAEEYRTPTFYFKAKNSENYTIVGDTVIINKNKIQDNGILLNVEVYANDPDLRSWYVSPKWKSESEYIVLDSIFTPTKTNNEYAYGVLNEYGSLTYAVAVGKNETYNTMFCTWQKQVTDKDRYSPMFPLGETSDAYPMTYFEAVISSDIPIGTYDIHFISKEEENEYQHAATGSFKTADGSSNTYTPILKNLNIVITEEEADFSLGDVNRNGVIDAVDATLVLRQYSTESLKGDDVIDDIGKACADVNGDGKIAATDATCILRYYSYQSLGGSDPIEVFIANN